MVALMALWWGCAAPEAPAEQPAPAVVAEVAAPAEPAESPAEEARRAEMRHHFQRVLRAQDAVIAGDSSAAREQLAGLARLDPSAGPPPAGGHALTKLREAAAAGAAAGDLAGVAAGLAGALRQCGACHQATGDALRLPPVGQTVDGGDVQAAMARHVWALDRLFDGLVGPSAVSWQVGAEALHEDAISEDDVPGDDAAALAAQLHELGGKARDERNNDLRAAIYGELLVTCAACHAIAGPPAPGSAR